MSCPKYLFLEDVPLLLFPFRLVSFTESLSLLYIVVPLKEQPLYRKLKQCSVFRSVKEIFFSFQKNRSHLNFFVRNNQGHGRLWGPDTYAKVQQRSKNPNKMYDFYLSFSSENDHESNPCKPNLSPLRGSLTSTFLSKSLDQRPVDYKK